MDRGQKQYTMPKVLLFITVYLKVEKDNVHIKDLYTILKNTFKKSLLLFKYSDPQIPNAIGKRDNPDSFLF